MDDKSQRYGAVVAPVDIMKPMAQYTHDSSVINKNYAFIADTMKYVDARKRVCTRDISNGTRLYDLMYEENIDAIGKWVIEGSRVEKVVQVVQLEPIFPVDEVWKMRL